jgi:cell filamentation protein
MYDSIDDPYCYPGTSVLKNRRDLRTQAALDRFETAITAQRFDEPLPAGKLTEQHYRRVHRHLFGDVYGWAGEYRTVRISKGDSPFCYPEYIASEMARLFAGLRRDNNLSGLSAQQFTRKAASFLSNLNAIHPFRRWQRPKPNGIHDPACRPCRASAASREAGAGGLHGGDDTGLSR